MTVNLYNLCTNENMGEIGINPPKAREPLKVASRLAYFVNTWKVVTEALKYWRPQQDIQLLL